MNRQDAVMYMNGRARMRGSAAQTIDQNDLNMMFKYSVHTGSDKTMAEIQATLEKSGPNVITLLDRFHDTLIREFKLVPNVSEQRTVMAAFMGGKVSKQINYYT